MVISCETVKVRLSEKLKLITYKSIAILFIPNVFPHASQLINAGPPSQRYAINAPSTTDASAKKIKANVFFNAQPTFCAMYFCACCPSRALNPKSAPRLTL